MRRACLPSPSNCRWKVKPFVRHSSSSCRWCSSPMRMKRKDSDLLRHWPWSFVNANLPTVSCPGTAWISWRRPGRPGGEASERIPNSFASPWMKSRPCLPIRASCSPRSSRPGARRPSIGRSKASACWSLVMRWLETRSVPEQRLIGRGSGGLQAPTRHH